MNERLHEKALAAFANKRFSEAIDAVLAVALEEAAKVADGWVGCSEWSADTNSGYECASRESAAAIRAMIPQ